MKVLVFSDSHGYNMSMAYAIEREKPDAVLHLGDHTDDADDIRRAFPALTIYHVRGNNDFDMDVPLFAVVTVGGVRSISRDYCTTYPNIAFQSLFQV